MSFLSDSSDEETVNELLSQAIDNSVLEQIAKINCASFNTDSVLPISLETRFSRLKSFPVTYPKGNFNTHFEKKIAKDTSDENEQNPGGENEFGLNLGSSSDLYSPKTLKKTKKYEKGKNLGSGSVSSLSNSSDSSKFPNRERNLVSSSDLFGSKTSKTIEKTKISKKEKKLGSGYVSSPSNSSVSSTEGAIFSPMGENFGEKKAVKKSKSRSDLYDFSPSPPRKLGCLTCSPKWGFGKKSKGQRGIRYDEEFLSDLSIKQQKLLEKALREEEKIAREAEKIVELVKQGSARMNTFDIK